MSDQAMKFGVRYIGSSGRGFARFTSREDAREFVAIPTNGNLEIVNLITPEVIK